MNIINLINKKNIKDFKIGESLNLKLKLDNNKISEFSGLIKKIKKKRYLTILRKINNIYFNTTFDIKSPLIEKIKILKK